MKIRAVALLTICLLSGGCVSNQIGLLEAMQSSLAQRYPDTVEYNRPRVLTYRAQEDARAEYPHFSVLGPATGKWQCLYGMQHMTQFTRDFSSRRPGMILMAASSKLRELEVEGLPPQTNITTQAQLTLLMETMLRITAAELAAGPSGQDNVKRANPPAKGAASALDSSRLPKEMRAQPFRIRSREVVSDPRYSDIGVRYRVVFEAERNRTQVIVNEGFCFVPRKNRERFITASAMWWGVEKNTTEPDDETRRFLDSFKSKR